MWCKVLFRSLVSTHKPSNNSTGPLDLVSSVVPIGHNTMLDVT